ncbi:MAG: APC family permease [Anaerolineae bacterium]|jgi:amino acid transporter|nr:APC family permease [Anaerolineae bacterium]MDH7474701.1 APC family permease [Anaerolineae bacterium]
MWSRIKYLLLGPPLPTQQLEHKRLNKIRALAAFSPDALSSIAYANQEIYLGLVVAGSAGLSMSLPIGLAITSLLVLVALSYFQTIHGYPSGGGSYVVARKNLGTLPGLIAAAALIMDYLLTAAVSLTAGVEAIASAFSALWSYRVIISLVLLAVITLLNLRGLRETGTLMAVPVYLFLFTYLPMLAYGVVRLLIDGPGSLAAAAPPATQPVTTFLVLRTFAAGCTALTGIEAISNGVPAFQPPEAKNAGRTLMVMALLMALLFVGSIGLTQTMAVISGPEETILSALSRRLLGNGPAYLVIQISTMLILAVAANTSFAGLPRLMAILGTDGFLPRQLTNLGARLVFANGIVLLSIAAGTLIVVFGGNTHALIPLFAVGVFLAVTLSQVGMVVHWWRERGHGWWYKAGINGVGALATAVALIVIGISKFIAGAWITILLIPILVMVFFRIRAHYQEVAQQLSLEGLSPGDSPFPHPRLVVPVPGIHRGVLEAIAYARSISDDVTAVYIELQPGTGRYVQERWMRWCPDVPLVILNSPYRSVVGPLLDFLDETDRQRNDGQLATVVLPEFVPARWWHALLHSQTAWLIRVALLYRRRRWGFQRAIIDVPYHLRR